MAKSLVWKDLSPFQIDAYCNLASREDCLSYLSGIFELGNDDKSIILKDLYYYTLEFAKANKLTPPQMSAYFSIVKETHRTVSANPKIMLERDYSYFKNLVLCHSIQRPPYSENIFGYKLMMLLLDYTTNTYFRHYLMYKYVFSKKMRLELVIENFMPTNIEDPKDQSAEQQNSDTLNTDMSNILKDEKSMVPETQSQRVSAAVTPESQLRQKEELQANDLTLSDSPPVPQQSLPTTPFDLDSKQAGSLSPATPRTAKHEAAINELKSFISTVLSSKLDEIKTSVASKIQGSDDSKKDSAKPKSKK